MGIIRRMYDGLTNALTGLGSTADARTGNRYCFRPLTHVEIEAAYRGSGLMRKCIDIPALDSVREWRDWQAAADQIEKIEAEEKRLGLQGKVLQAEILRGLGGGALILGLPGEPALPFNARGGERSLAYIHVVDRWKLSATNWIDDPTREGFGGPEFWQVNVAGRGQVRIHPSRVVCFRGDPLPQLSSVSADDAFWGDNRIARILDAVQNSDTAQAAFAGLISKARSTIVGIPGLLEMTATEEGEQLLHGRMAAMVLGESLYNVTLKDNGDGKAEGSGETIDHRQVTWTGIPDVIRVFAEAVAAAADIPMTRLWGKSAEGMNASGDSQQRDYHKQVRAKQELSLRPCLEQLDAVLVPSALGSRPDDVWFKFAPLDTPTETEETARFKSFSEAVEKIINSATIPDRAMAEAVQNTMVESGFLVGLDTALAKIPEEERYGIEPEADPDLRDPSELQAANENQIEEMQQRGAISADQARALITDARPRPLYVRRDVVNVADLKAWAKQQGLPELQPGLHVTIVYSPTPVDWMKIDGEWGSDDKGEVTIPPGGVRIVEPLGDRTAVLLFTSSALSWRHESIVRAGASHGYDSYQPHISLTGEAVDLSGVEPYRGKIVLGPEIFEELVTS